MTIDASLDSLILPALPTYQNEFGTKKQDGGLTTAECVDGVMVWGRRQRPFPVTENSDTSTVEANCTFEVLTAGIELIIADASFSGCEVKVINASDGEITVKGGASGLNGSADAITIPARAMVFLTFFEGWITSNSTYSGSTEVSDFEKRIFLASHPVKSYYKTDDPRNPGDVYGGTWEQIKDRVLIAAGDSFPAGSTGGQTSITLAVDNLPSHSHSFTPSGNISITTNPTFSGNRGTVSVSGADHSHIIGSAAGGNSGAYPKGYYETNTTTRTANSGSLSMSGSFTPSGSISGGTYQFTGKAGRTQPSGSTSAINIMNPYRAVYTWKRTA